MRSPGTSFALGLAFLLILFVSLGSALAAAETFPTDNTRIAQIVLYDNTTPPGYRIIANYDADGDIQYAIIGDILGRIKIGVNVGLEYVPEIMDAVHKTRVHVQIADDENVIFAGFLEWTSTGGWGDSWRVGFNRANLNIVLVSSVTITITYEIYTTSWQEVETWIDYLEVGETLPAPGVPEAVPSLWLPYMMSFALIVGMTFIGFNLTRSRDPTPALFMLFAGAMLSWSIGWLPTWVFVTAIALISLSGAALWGKLFKGR